MSFSLIKDWQKISWNSKEICVNNTPIFYNVYFESGIVFVKDLLLHSNNTDSFRIVANIVNKTSFFGLDWT